jgi:hypothetical protein
MLHLGRFLIASMVVAATLTAQAFAADPPKVELNKQPGQVEITVGGKPFATYVYADPKISRPYFAHVHAPNGTQVTRNHPPIAGKDKMDHPEFHPGIWLAFGDIEGNDYWRLKAPVEHSRFYPDRTNDTFSVLNRYLAANDPSDLICEEVCHFQIAPTPFGIMLLWDSTFLGVHKFTFGDQEEMGLGVRVATPMRVEAGDGSIPPGTGTMTDAKGRKNGAEIGGNDSDWCDYSGTVDGQQVGITIFCHPDNFRPSWFHARDYGFFAANAFGRAAFKKGPPSKVDVLPEDEFQLRYGVLVHSSADGKQPDLNAAFEYYKRLAGSENLRALE